MRAWRARAAARSSLIAAFAILALLGSSLPLAARPYGARGFTGELRYGTAAADARVRCSSMTDSAGRTRSLCVHWVTSGRHRPINADWVTATRAAFARSWNIIVRDGRYRRPLADGGKPAGHGPNTGVDIYIADIADDGTFGYCTHDRGSNPKGETPIPAYCVVDNDLAGVGVPVGERITELRGTAAHEFFHAVQYAYDPSTRKWFSEGTAVAMENRVHLAANTEHRYLDITALRQPEDPFDIGGATGYGSWLFWQYLAEAHDNATVRSVWAGMANRQGTTSDVFAALTATTGTIVGHVMAEFGAWNYAIGEDWSYAEGAEYLEDLGSRPPLAASHTLTATRTDTDMTGSNAPRAIVAEPRSIHYVRLKAEVTRTVHVTVNRPDFAAYMVQTGTGLGATFTQPTLIAEATTPIALQAGQSALLVLTNPLNEERSLTYRALAP